MTTATATAETTATGAHPRSEKLTALQATLADAVAGLVTGDDWRRALEFAAQFRSRSFRNTLLILVQHAAAYDAGLTTAPTPSYVAGYQQWQDMGRQVRRGAKGYGIFAPVTALHVREGNTWVRLPKGKKPAPGQVARRLMVGTKVATVFDISMTDGPEIPTPPRPQLLTGQAPEGLWDGIVTQIHAAGFDFSTVPTAAAIGGAEGVTNFTNRTVKLRADAEPLDMVATAIHELAHIHQEGTPTLDGLTGHRGLAEVEAESVSLLVLAAHGVDTTRYTLPYVATWASRVDGTDPADVVRSTADHVHKIATRILDQLDTHQIPDGRPETPETAEALAEGE